MLEESLILLQIIFIDIILAADNAIIIGLIAANFVPKNRKLIIFWGVVGALVFKVLFAVTVFQENARKFREVFSFRASACVFRHVSKSGTRKVVRSEPPSLLTVLILKRRYCCILAHVYFQGNFCTPEAG